MRNLSKVAAAIACTVISFHSLAEDTRHVDAHIHGAGHLNFAVEGNQVHLELEAPGFDILGFESISSEAQHHELDHAIEKLKTADLWVLTPAASCHLLKVDVETGEDHDDQAEHDEHEKHVESDEDKGHNKHDQPGDEGHMDIEATYVYQCAHIDKLNSISTKLFDQFSNSQKLKVQGFTNKGQVAGYMTREQPEVHF